MYSYKLFLYFFFFFSSRRRHTRWNCYWSSDVCSSDLQLQTGSSSIIALSNKTFFPYTDLLLHDMGTALDDGYTEGIALSAEWRTPPLWGLGLSKNSQRSEERRVGKECRSRCVEQK